MDSLHIVIALGPVATYLVVLGLINLSSRPLLTTGARDVASLAIALLGLIVAGPMNLFLVEEAAVLYGAWVWLIMLVAYGLVVLLIVLLLRPRLVVYNITVEQLQPLVAEIATRLDPDAQWAGDGLAMPRLGVQLHLEASPLLKNVQLVSSGPEQSLAGWRQFQVALNADLRRVHTGPNQLGVGIFGVGILFIMVMTFVLAGDPAGTVQAVNEMLRR